jgi:hypothetical protein
MCSYNIIIVYDMVDVHKHDILWGDYFLGENLLEDNLLDDNLHGRWKFQ